MGLERGEGDPVSIERVIADDSIDYDSSNDTVRFPTLMGSEGPVAYKTESFESWADRRCASVGSEAVLPTIQDRFEKAVQSIGKAVGREDTREELGMVITVWAITHRNREGEIDSKPNFSFQALVDRTPRSVHTTITLEDREHTRSVPVFVEETEIADL